MPHAICYGHACFASLSAIGWSCGHLPLLSAGFLGFYDGLRAKIVQSVLAAALLMAIKEELTNTARVLLNGVPQPVVVAAEKMKDAAEIVQQNNVHTK